MTSMTIYPMAFLAGIISFISPCVLPLLPGYLSFISGSSVQEIKDGKEVKNQQMLLTTILFVLGFSTIFTLLGSAFGFAGVFLQNYRQQTQQVGGLIIIAMGLFMIGTLKIPFLYREIRFMPKNRKFGALSAYPLGMAFAVGWTPCIGPILASIYMLALNAPGRGASLLLVYSLGLGVPFIISGLLFSRLTNTLDWFKKNSVFIHRFSGATLILVGVLLVAGRWTALVAPLQRYFQLPV